MTYSIRNIMAALFILTFSLTNVLAEDGHEHSKDEGHGEEEHKHDGEHGVEDELKHAEEGDHGHHEEGGHEEAGHEEEGGAKVGPDKGITEKGENGFKLSKEATAAFNLKFTSVLGQEIEVPKSTIVHIKNGKFVYRVRDGWINRIPVSVTLLPAGQAKVQSHDLNNGDQVVTSGTGFIRGAELILSEGATHSH